MKCELCNNPKCVLITENLRYKAQKSIYRCSECGLVFLSPKMTPEEERTFYEQEYGDIYSAEKGTTPAKLFESRQTDAQLYHTWVQDFLDPTDNCLEIGCASGYFLMTIRAEVHSIAGIETHHLLRDYCRTLGIEMFDRLDDIGDEQFDKIFLFFVLEHLGEPMQFFEQLRRILKPNGKIFIVVPNVDDALLSLYDIPAFQSFYYTPAHQFYYSRKTLGKLLEKSGFMQYEIRPIQRYDLSNHMHWMMYGKPGGMGRYNHVFSESLCREYAENLKDHNICDTLYAIVTK
jgi:SAM-dependent methyltransferase